MTVREIVKRALRLVRAVPAGREPSERDAADALDALRALILSLPEIGGGGPWRDAEISADHAAREDERVRVITPDAVAVTLPDQVRDEETSPPRPPRNGARVQLVDMHGEARGFWLYRADRALWVEVSRLTLNDPSPLDGAFDGALSALLAQTIAPEYGAALDPGLLAQAERGRSQIKARLAPTQRAGVEAAFLILSASRSFRL
jgi:hypothetical protein